MEEGQKIQFIEFSSQWDTYMQDYEQTAITSMEKLKLKHQKALEALADVVGESHRFKSKPSREIREMKKQIEVLV